jgi:hypothetical protein
MFWTKRNCLESRKKYLSNNFLLRVCGMPENTKHYGYDGGKKGGRSLFLPSAM